MQPRGPCASCGQTAHSLQTRGNLASRRVMAGHQGDASSPFAHRSKGPWPHSSPPTATRRGPALGGAVPLRALEEG